MDNKMNIETEKQVLESTKRLAAFSGADCLIVLNNKVCGEVYSFEINSIKCQLALNVTNFLVLTTLLKELSETKNSELYEVYLDEYGHKMYRKFCNVNYIGELFNISVDSINPLHKLIFEYTPSEDNFYKEIDKKLSDSLDGPTIIDFIKNGEL